MNKYIKYGLTAISATVTGAVTALLLLEKENKKIGTSSKFQCENCPYGKSDDCLKNERILNPEEFMNNAPLIVVDCVLNYYPKRILRPLCLKFLHFDHEKSRVVCYSYKQEKIVYINVNYENVDDIKITVTAG